MKYDSSDAAAYLSLSEIKLKSEAAQLFEKSRRVSWKPNVKSLRLPNYAKEGKRLHTVNWGRGDGIAQRYHAALLTQPSRVRILPRNSRNFLTKNEISSVESVEKWIDA